MIKKDEKFAEMELYSEIAENYGNADSNPDVIFLKKVIENFTLRYNPNSVLDLGTGNGRYLKSICTNLTIAILLIDRCQKIIKDDIY